MRLKKEETNECEDVPNALVTSNIRQYIAKLNKKTIIFLRPILKCFDILSKYIKNKTLKSEFTI